MKLSGGTSAWLRNERASAGLLLPMAAIALLCAPHGLDHFFHLQQSFQGESHSIKDWVALGPLVLFFYVAGAEIRIGIDRGGIREQIPAISGALLGMVIPALIFVALARASGTSSTAWGIPMATDLPLALAALTLIPKRMSSHVRGFLLTLAIADDVGSILVIALRFHRHISTIYLASSLLLLALFFYLSRRIRWQLTELGLLLIGIATWWCAIKSGIHPTVFGVLLGLALPALSAEREVFRWEPIVGFLIVPLFVLSALSISLSWSIDKNYRTLPLLVVIARVIGKPVGIFMGAKGASKIFAIPLPFQPKKLLLVGILGIFGFSVSLLFTNLSLTGAAAGAAILGIILALPLGALVLCGYYFLTRDTAA